MRNKMEEKKKYDINKYTHESVEAVGMISTTIGLGGLIAGAFTGSLEALALGGPLFVGGPILFLGDYAYSYMRNQIDYMNEQDENKDKKEWREK